MASFETGYIFKWLHIKNYSAFKVSEIYRSGDFKYTYIGGFQKGRSYSTTMQGLLNNLKEKRLMLLRKPNTHKISRFYE